MVTLARKERDRLLRKNDILRAAEKVFARKGYHRTKIQDIAKESQYAVGTIYLYFRDKEVLYIELIEKKLEDLNREIREEIKNKEEVEEKIKTLVRKQLAYFEENQDFFRIYFLEREWLNWGLRDRIFKKAVGKFMKYIDYISNLFKQAQRESLIRKDLDTKKLAYILASMLNALLLSWLKETKKKGKIIHMADFIIDIFFRGVMAR
ncbi:MAG: TetR/AcrR family transcriptional regulator [Candidatus Omnitrophica bacterium]|nr:TetR/AcrR family transcriptional regulator [Candidatus Omnitrophota bacterium]MCM8826852.1 TetR/AcrR family transcriptional regulator [Candidatus Omnitrophota bacterium]